MTRVSEPIWGRTKLSPYNALDLATPVPQDLAVELKPRSRSRSRSHSRSHTRSRTCWLPHKLEVVQHQACRGGHGGEESSGGAGVSNLREERERERKK